MIRYFLLLLFYSFFRDLFLAQRAVVVIFKPLFDAVLVKVVLFIAWQWNNVISLCELDHAYGAFRICIVTLRVEFRSVQGLYELRCRRHPLRTLGIPHSKEKDRDENADEKCETKALEHLYIT